MTRRWYQHEWRNDGTPLGRVQLHDWDKREIDALRSMPEHILRLAQAEYEQQYGRSQDYERMQERGGFSVSEVVTLLADHLDRVGAKPTRPRAPGADR